jgi:hypothetical protein
MQVDDVPQEYRETVGTVGELLRGGGASQGDPDRAADILVRIVHADNLPSHLLLGAGAANMALNYSRTQIAEATAWQAVSASADAGADYPVDLLATP